MTTDSPPDGRARPARVVVRPPEARDQEEFLALVAASVTLHRPWMTPPSTAAAFAAYLRRYAGPDEESLLVCRRDTGAIAGMVNINSIIRGRFQNGSLGYAAFAPSAGQGYLSEGLGLVVRHAFERLRLHRLARPDPAGNHASLRLVRRLGFRYEGLSPELLFIDGAWRDHERWAITSAMAGVAAAPHPSLPAR